ncbi:MAG: (deoxy)nucleoside triphosphate pyrophosphohydrolase [Acidobacteria bacterium]|nr:(deoxy)nucleoside triphosphate pyrophosphohydrolase [Acidobacteriota bacterium]
MIVVVAAVIERADRRILIGQRRREDTSPLKWEFPGGKVKEGETDEAALGRELREELDAEMVRSAPIARLQHKYAETAMPLEIRFYAAELKSGDVQALAFEQIAWVLPRELSEYDFLAANRELVANLATGRIKPSEILAATK